LHSVVTPRSGARGGAKRLLAAARHRGMLAENVSINVLWIPLSKHFNLQLNTSKFIAVFSS
jgi:hypothetical protein